MNVNVVSYIASVRIHLVAVGIELVIKVYNR